MRKIFFLYAALVIIVVILAAIKFQGFNFISAFKPKTVEVAKQQFKVEIADSDKERMKGLSNRNSLNDNNGMLFIFESKGKYSFWMKEVEFPLDIIFISDDTIVDIVKNAPPQKEVKGSLPIYTPQKEANYVLEIKGGLSDRYSIKTGDKIKINK